MRIAFVTAHLSSVAGGFRYAVAGMAQATARDAALDAHIFGVRDPRDPEGWRDWNQPGLTIHAMQQRGPLAFAWAPAFGSALQEVRPDLIHAQGLWMYPSMASLHWHRRSGRPHLVAPHGMLDPWALSRGRVKKRLAACGFEDQHLRQAACLHALTPAEACAMRAYGLRNPICIVPNGIDLPREIVRVAQPGRERVLLFLSRIDPKKGVRELILAWSLVNQEAERLGWHLQIVGWGNPSYVDNMQRLVTECDLAGSVTLSGPRFGQEKTATFLGADAFILPSFSEGLPVAVLEAWSYGLPVLITAACNLNEGVRADSAIETSTDPKALAESLRRLFALSDARRKEIGQRGRRLVEQRFSWGQIGEQLRDVYGWLLYGHCTPTCIMTD